MTRHSWPVARPRTQFLSCFSPGTIGQHLQTGIPADAMLQMDHIIAFLQIGKIDVQQRARGLGVRRFQSTRPLNFVTPENLRVRHDHEFALIVNEPTSQSAQVG